LEVSIFSALIHFRKITANSSKTGKIFKKFIYNLQIKNYNILLRILVVFELMNTNIYGLTEDDTKH